MSRRVVILLAILAAVIVALVGLSVFVGWPAGFFG